MESGGLLVVPFDLSVRLARRLGITTFAYRNGVFTAPDRIDEHTDMPDFGLQTDEILKIDFSRVKILNSYGTRLLVRTTRAWEPRPMEFHNCSPVVIDTINVVQAILGTEPMPRRIVSFSIPYICEESSDTAELLVRFDDIKWEDDYPIAPPMKCPSCQKDMELDVEPEVFFAFMRFDEE